MFSPLSDLDRYHTSLSLLQKQTWLLSTLYYLAVAMNTCSMSIISDVTCACNLPDTCVSPSCSSGWQKYRFTKQFEFLIFHFQARKTKTTASPSRAKVFHYRKLIWQKCCLKNSQIAMAWFGPRGIQVAKTPVSKSLLYLQRTFDLYSLHWGRLWGKQSPGLVHLGSQLCFFHHIKEKYFLKYYYFYCPSASVWCFTSSETCNSLNLK